MNLLNSRDQKNYSSSSKHNKKRLTQDQVGLLEASFHVNKKLDPELKLQLSRKLAIPPRQIAIWYQNKRVRWKNQNLELDYNTLQVRLEAALADKRHLQKEIERLQHELHKVQAEAAHPRPVSSLSSTCDEGGSSSLHDDVVVDCLQVEEELYAFWMGANGSNYG